MNISGNYSELYKTFLIEHLKPLPKDQEPNRIRQGQEGDEEARAEVLRTCYKLVLKLANKIADGRVEPNRHDSLIAVGFVALDQAFDRYETDSTARFSTFAYASIYGQMLRSSNKDSHLVAVPYSYTPVVAEWRRSGESAEELAAMFSKPVEAVEAVLNVVRQPVSMDEHDSVFAEPALSPEDLLMQALAKDEVCTELKKLDPESLFVIAHTFGACGFEEMEPIEIAELYGLSSGRVRFLRKRGLEVLATYLAESNASD